MGQTLTGYVPSDDHERGFDSNPGFMDAGVATAATEPTSCERTGNSLTAGVTRARRDLCDYGAHTMMSSATAEERVLKLDHGEANASPAAGSAGRRSPKGNARSLHRERHGGRRRL